MSNKEFINMDEMIKKDDILMKYYNIGILNMLNYTIKQVNGNSHKIISESKENKINVLESNMQEHFKFNKSLQDKIDKSMLEEINERTQDKINKDELLIKRKKDFLKKFVELFRDIRNIHSHNSNSEKYKKCKIKYEQNSNYVLDEIKIIFKKTSLSLFFQNANEFDIKVFYACMFLNKNELNELKKDLEFVNSNLLLTYIGYFQKYRHIIGIAKYKDNIDILVLNLIKNTREIKNFRRVFFKSAIKLLNYKFNDIAFKFSFKDPNKNELIIKIEKIKNEESKGFIYVNYSSLKKIILLSDKAKIISLLNESINNTQNNIFNYEKKDIIKRNNENEFKSFTNKLKKIEIDNDYQNYSNNRWLIKTFNRVMINFDGDAIVLDRENKELSAINFEMLFQIINTNNKTKFSNNKTLIGILKSINIIDNDSFENLKNKIINYILLKINNVEQFVKLYKKTKNPPKLLDSKKENSKLTFFNIDIEYKKNYKEIFLNLNEMKESNNSVLYLKNIQNINNIKKYLLPLIYFHYHNFDYKENDSFDINKCVSNWKEKEGELIFPIWYIVKIFKNKIRLNKNIKVIYVDNFDSNNIKYIFESNLYQNIISNRDLIHSKLFLEILKLFNYCNLDKNNEINLSQKDWDKAVKFHNEYIKYEIWIMNEIKKLEGNNNYEKIISERNYIFHRSLSKFKNIDQFNKFRENFYSKNLTMKNKIMKKNMHEKTDDIEEEIINFNYKTYN